MDECVLVRPDASRLDDIRDFRREMLDGGGMLFGAGPLARMESAEEWLAFCGMLEAGENLPEHLVPCDQYLFVRKTDGRLLGMIQVRRRFNAFLKRFGGHIGYCVRPSERRKGYAKRMLAACLPRCKASGLTRVLITCTVENEASRRAILANGGRYERTVYLERDHVMLERYWIDL